MEFPAMAIHKQICKAIFNDAVLFKLLKAENVLIRQEANGQYRYQRNKVVLDICKEDMKNKKLKEYQKVVADADEHMFFAFSGQAKTKGKTHYKEWVKTQAKRLKSMLKKQFRHESRLVPNRKDAEEFALPVDDYDDEEEEEEAEKMRKKMRKMRKMMRLSRSRKKKKKLRKMRKKMRKMRKMMRLWRSRKMRKKMRKMRKMMSLRSPTMPPNRTSRAKIRRMSP